MCFLFILFIMKSEAFLLLRSQRIARFVDDNFCSSYLQFKKLIATLQPFINLKVI